MGQILVGNRKRVRSIAWLAAFSMLGQFVFPIFFHPAMATAEELVPLCTAHGVVFVPAPANEGAPVTPVQSSPFCPCCLSAQQGGKALTPTDPGVPAPSLAFIGFEIKTEAPRLAQRNHGAVGARAPPWAFNVPG
jgi:hypothetical protein